MNEVETVNNELTETLGYLIDKFNLTLEVSSEQIKEFSTQMAEKIITWEFVTSLVAIAGWVLVLLFIARVHEQFKIGSFKELNKQYNELWNTTGDRARQDVDKLTMKYIFKIVVIFLLLLFTSFIISELKDIVMCAVFPEKVILEFISNYL